MSTYVGVNVAEVDGTASPAIVPAPTSVAAFVGIAERGPLNVPVRVSDADGYAARFGGPISGGYLGYAVAGFFANGGREAYVCRIAGAATKPSMVTLDDRATTAAPSLQLRAGFRGRPDPGAWGDRLRVDVRDDPRAVTKAAAASAPDGLSVKLASTAGIAPGSVLRFAGSPDQRKVTAVDPDGTVHWAGALSAPIAIDAAVSSAEFRIIVRAQDAPGAPPTSLEEWAGLTMEPNTPDYAPARLNDEFTGSRFLVATDVSAGAASGIKEPKVVSLARLQDGADAAPAALDFSGSAAARTGFEAFAPTAVQLLAAPDLHRLPADQQALVIIAALDYCERRGDLMFVGSARERARRAGVAIARARSDYAERESEYVDDVIETVSEAFQRPKAYGALYAPWIRVADPAAAGAAPVRFVPPEGHVMGIYARTDLERGIWKAPAGISATVRGALDVAAVLTDAQHDALVRAGFVNGIRPAPGIGISVAASRTLSTDTRWWYVNVRLLFNFVKSSLRDGLRFVRQQPHSGELRRRVKFNVVTPFLLNLWRRGAFGSDDAAAVFTVVCDETNNPLVEVDQGNFHIDVTFYPVRPAETVVIKVGQQPSGSSASEA